jgi:hypothetical protein
MGVYLWEGSFNEGDEGEEIWLMGFVVLYEIE